MLETITQEDLDDLLMAGTGASPEARDAAVERGQEEWDRIVEAAGLGALEETVEVQDSALNYIPDPSIYETPMDILAPRQ